MSKSFETIWAEADAAGRARAEATKPTPMVVTERANPLDDTSAPVRSWYVPSGVCGFGYVKFPGNTAFGRWAKKTGRARPGYPTGLYASSPLMTQSYELNSAWAYGFADSLRSNGIDRAYAETRLD